MQGPQRKLRAFCVGPSEPGVIMFKAVLRILKGYGKPVPAHPPVADRHASSRCQICQQMAPYLDTVDLNKSCVEPSGRRLPPSGIPVHYYLCAQCGFCFAPDLQQWTPDAFGRFIYNEGYEFVDPDYVTVRPTNNSNWIDGLFGASKGRLRHLDYGGGSGQLSAFLREKGWDSASYDPFADPDVRVEDLGRYDLVTAFEVFEHVPKVADLMDDLGLLCKPDGLILFSTLLSDGELAPGRPLTWWYASPRNGHISLFSADSLKRCITDGGWMLGSFTTGLHAAYRQLPPWAAHLRGGA